MTTSINPTDGVQELTVRDATADETLNRNDCPILYHNTSAVGTVTITLPQDAKGGEIVKAAINVAQAFRFAPGAAGGIWATNGTTFAKQADNKYVGALGLGEAIELVSLGNGDWLATSQSDMLQAASIGFITIEA